MAGRYDRRNHRWFGQPRPINQSAKKNNDQPNRTTATPVDETVVAEAKKIIRRLLRRGRLSRGRLRARRVVEEPQGLASEQQVRPFQTKISETKQQSTKQQKNNNESSKF